jgi:hypothetical protein
MKKEECGFLVLSFDNNLLYNCIKSIRDHYKDLNIYIIDNNKNNNKPKIVELENIYYVQNNYNGFAWGAFKTAIKTFPYVKKWIFIHNNYVLLDRFPSYIFEYDYVPFYKCSAINFCLLLPWMEHKCNELSIPFKYNEQWYPSNGCLCSINSNILHDFFNLKLDTVHSNCKVEAVGQELFFGYIIEKILKIPIKYILNNNDICVNIKGVKPWKYIKYVSGGQGISNLNSFFLINGEMKQCTIDYNLLKHHIDRYNNIVSNNMSLNDKFIVLFKEFENSNIGENLLNKICNQYPGFKINIINYTQSNKNILEQFLTAIITRLCYGKKYIKDLYYEEYNKIINKEKIIYRS